MAKNVAYLMEYIHAGKWDEYHAIVNGLEDDVRNLRKAYIAHIDGNPADSIAEFVANVGKDRAIAVIATLINRHGWDGRISRRNKEWAASRGYDEGAASKMGIYTDIHMCHLDQLASSMRKFEEGAK